MPSFSTRTQAHIIMACMALHNFIRDSALQDDVFNKCDEDENYMLRDEDDTEEQEVAQPEVDETLEEENGVTINTVRDNIANALVS
jgi:hypothetical protein